jgi:membrane fusion protein (multidrug efflux system)
MRQARTLLSHIRLSNICLATTLCLSAQAVLAQTPSRPVSSLPSVGQGGNKNKTLNDEMECLLEAKLIADVGSPVEGTLAQVAVDRGDNVRAGQMVARLNSNVESATLDLKRAQLEYGERKVQRNDDLFKKNLISASDKDELETQTRIASLEVKQQQQVLALRTIVSPINGVVVERFLSPGNHVSQEKIVRIAQLDPLNVETVLPVALFGQIKPGSLAELKATPFIPGNFKARVTVVDRVVDAASGTFRVRLELSNPGNRIPAGIKCSVKFSP